MLPWAVLIQKSQGNQDQFIFRGAFAFVEHQIFLGQQSIQCTGMKSGPMSPINEKKAPTLGQGKVRLARGIYITVIGFAELKDHRTGKGFKADPGAVSTGQQGGHSRVTFIPYLGRCVVWSRFSRVMVGKAQDRRTPSSRGKAEKKRQDRIEMVQNLTPKKGQWFREGSDCSTLLKPLLLKSRADATTVLEETLCKM